MGRRRSRSRPLCYLVVALVLTSSAIILVAVVHQQPSSPVTPSTPTTPPGVRAQSPSEVSIAASPPQSPPASAAALHSLERGLRRPTAGDLLVATFSVRRSRAGEDVRLSVRSRVAGEAASSPILRFLLADKVSPTVAHWGSPQRFIIFPRS